MNNGNRFRGRRGQGRGFVSNFDQAPMNSTNKPQESSDNKPKQEEIFCDWGALIATVAVEQEQLCADLPKVKKLTYVECNEVKVMSQEKVAEFREKNNAITVIRLNEDSKEWKAPNPIFKFGQALSPYPDLLATIEAQGFPKPSPIQCQLWPLLMGGTDAIGVAQTGTGKTLGFLVPALLHISEQALYATEKKMPLCLILAPTRELAQQIEREANKFKYKGIKSACIYGQGDYAAQCRTLRAGVQIVVATPGRLIDFVNKEVLDLRAVSYLVLDEADRMLDMGFQPDILKITAGIRKDRQTVLTSATWPCDVEYIARRLMREDAVRVRVGREDLAAVATVAQRAIVVEEEDKTAKLLEILSEFPHPNKAIIFSNRKTMVDYIATFLYENDMDCRIMHGGVEQSDREAALSDLASGACRILVATDVAARGIDIVDLALVVNLDLPRNLDEYVHRCGRTGRAGRSGNVVSFVSWANRQLAQQLIDIMQRSDQEVPSDLVRLAERAKRQREKRQAESSTGSRGRGGGGFGNGGFGNGGRGNGGFGGGGGRSNRW